MIDPIVPSTEDIQSSISAAFDSVNLINELNLLETLTQQEEDRLDRNVRHLEIMIGKSWFTDNLTVEQRQSIDAAISAN